MSKLPLQSVAIIPTSNAPPTWEWSKPSWYVLFLDALQASPDLNDGDAALLVHAFEARKITLPCGECRGHYATDWDTHPFTLEHARSAALATAWVQALKDRVDARVAAEKKAEAAAAAVPPRGAAVQPRGAAVPRSVQRGGSTTNRFATRTPMVSAVRAAAATRLAAAHPAGTPVTRAHALQRALSDTAANRNGIVRGCRTCGRGGGGAAAAPK